MYKKLLAVKKSSHELVKGKRASLIGNLYIIRNNFNNNNNNNDDDYNITQLIIIIRPEYQHDRISEVRTVRPNPRWFEC